VDRIIGGAQDGDAWLTNLSHTRFGSVGMGRGIGGFVVYAVDRIIGGA
jgi:hypothetical protein